MNNMPTLFDTARYTKWQITETQRVAAKRGIAQCRSALAKAEQRNKQ